MERLRDHRYAEAITAARQLLPPAIDARLHPHFLTGTDPVWAGLHNYTDCSYGRSYRDTMHVAGPEHQRNLPTDRRWVTVVIPTVPQLPDLVHELGHVLDRELPFKHTAQPVSWYANDNREEAFAEAFAAWLIPGYADRPLDPATVALFESLAVEV